MPSAVPQKDQPGEDCAEQLNAPGRNTKSAILWIRLCICYVFAQRRIVNSDLPYVPILWAKGHHRNVSFGFSVAIILGWYYLKRLEIWQVGLKGVKILSGMCSFATVDARNSVVSLKGRVIESQSNENRRWLAICLLAFGIKTGERRGYGRLVGGRTTARSRQRS